MMMPPRPLQTLLLLSALLLSPLALGATRTITAAGTEVDVAIAPAGGETLLLWLPCYRGNSRFEAPAARALARAGIESWRPDLMGAHFLPALPSSTRQIPGAEVAALARAAAAHGRRVVLVAGGHMALPALRGAIALQAAGTPPAGVILIYPKLLKARPDAGEAGEYLPETRQLKVPVVILQPAQSPERFWLPRLSAALHSGGAPVRSRLLPGTRNYFFCRQDLSTTERKRAERLAPLLRDALKMLATEEKH